MISREILTKTPASRYRLYYFVNYGYPRPNFPQNPPRFSQVWYISAKTISAKWGVFAWGAPTGAVTAPKLTLLRLQCTSGRVRFSPGPNKPITIAFADMVFADMSGSGLSKILTTIPGTPWVWCEIRGQLTRVAITLPASSHNFRKNRFFFHSFFQMPTGIRVTISRKIVFFVRSLFPMSAGRRAMISRKI